MATTLTTLQLQQGDGGANATFWGPEFGFGRTLVELGATHTLVVKASRGGGSNSLWDKTTFDAFDDAGHMWGHLRDTVDAALAAVTATPGDTFRIRGLLFLQGESNTAGDAAVAGQRLADLATHLTAHIEATHPGTTTGMKTVIGEIAASGGTAARITTTDAQRALAASNDTFAFVPTSDIAAGGDPVNGNSGRRVTLTFVDPGSRAKAAVAGLGFELRAVTGDGVTATFLDANGVALYQTGTASWSFRSLPRAASSARGRRPRCWLSGQAVRDDSRHRCAGDTHWFHATGTVSRRSPKRQRPSC